MRSRDAQPDRTLPLLYLGLAHLSLLTAWVSIALDPAAVAGFYYHPRMVATVHLLTLGWVSASILGVVYMLGPMVLRAPLPRRALDFWAFGAYAVGVLGMVSHFWIDEPRGMAWSAATVLVPMAWVGWRLLGALAGSGLDFGAKLPFHLAFANLALAGVLGLLAGIDKSVDVLPGYVLHNVYAHAHLAALGWATMMVLGAGYRLLPMFLPSALPRGKAVSWSAALLEAGVLALTVSWMGAPALRLPAAVLCLAGLGLFVGQVVWMLRHPKPPPRRLARPDWGTLQALFALTCLLAAAALGFTLAATPPAPWKLPAAAVYGVLGLVGFLAQIVLGIGGRLIPLYVWISGFGGRVLEKPPPSPYELAARPGLAFVFGCWLLGVPGLAFGLAFDRLEVLRGAAALLAAGTATYAVEGIRVVLRSFRRE